MTTALHRPFHLVTALLVLLLAVSALQAAAPTRAAAAPFATTTTEKAAPSACTVARQRLGRARADVRQLRQRLRAARAAGNAPKVRRVKTRLRATERRQRTAQDRVRRACAPPDTRIVGGPGEGAVVQGSETAFRFASTATDVEAYQCSLDGARWNPCAYGADAVEEVESEFGRHVLRVRAVDRDGIVDPTPVTRSFHLHYYTSVDAGGDRTCGVRADGVLRCWGAPFPGGAQPPSGAFVYVDVGPGDTACATRRDYSIVCWGANDHGQATPPAHVSGYPYVGKDHACEGSTCWGDDSTGETDPPDRALDTLGSGNDFSCAISGGEGAYCWGKPDDGRTLAPPGVRLHAVGEDRACGARDGSGALVCWGKPFSVPDPAVHPFHLAIGADHGCTGFSEITCWGANTYGQVDVPPLPARLAGRSFGYRWAEVGRNHACAIRVDDVTVCWGDDRLGQSSPTPA